MRKPLLIILAAGVLGAGALVYVQTRGPNETATAKPDVTAAKTQSNTAAPTLPSATATPGDTTTVTDVPPPGADVPRVAPCPEGEDCMQREPPPLEAHPPRALADVTGDMIKRVEATRAEVRKAATRCVGTNAGHVEVRYFVHYKAGKASTSRVEQLASDVDAKTTACIIDAIKHATWTTTQPDGDVPLHDDMPMAELR